MDGLGWRAPRLGTGGRYYGVPTGVLWWAGIALAAITGNLVAVAFLRSVGLTTAALLPEPWLWWLPELAVCAVGAFVRPGGLDARAWLLVWLRYVATPRRAVYAPDAPRPLIHWW